MLNIYIPITSEISDVGFACTGHKDHYMALGTHYNITFRIAIISYYTYDYLYCSHRSRDLCQHDCDIHIVLAIAIS